MLKNKRKKEALDRNTKQYIKKVRLLQAVVLVVMVIAFTIFAHTIVSSNQNNLKEVALTEVQEAMQETIHNTTVHIESVRLRVGDDAMMQVMELEQRMTTGGVNSIEDIFAYLQVCEENQIGQAIEVIYITESGQDYMINRYERLVLEIDGSREGLY